MDGRGAFRRKRGRLVRWERVCEWSQQAHFSPWDVFVRDSLLQIAWPMSLSAEVDMFGDHGSVKLRSHDISQ
ncbi:uncharacterized protein LOC120352338 isoform X1 [Nilaparvata lugens]|uniref:uncharacterized protein LOC120352338 isoform X1 n=2 Tax=Nilaparvata lugens TaxID=108931 RepID=UPI00193D0905|nr:uncharacterized protein LOC120352338 isoform X1 [Nilaparvata lugens]